MPESEEYGSAHISIHLDGDGAVAEARVLGERIKRALEKAGRESGRDFRRGLEDSLKNLKAVRVPVEADLRGWKRQTQQALAKIKPVRIPVEADLRGWKKNTQALLAKVKAVKVPVEADLRGWRRNTEAALAKIKPIKIPVEPDLRGFGKAAAAAAAKLQPIKIPVTVDTASLRRALAELGGGSGSKGLRRALKDVGDSGGGLSKALAPLSRLVRATWVSLSRFSGIAIAVTGAVGGLVVALAPLAGVLAALPQAISGTVVVFGVLAAALNGVGEAFGAALTGDAAAFATAIEGLAPAARKAALAVQDLATPLHQLQQSLQQRFFAQVTGEIAGLRSVIPAISSGLQGVATHLGEAAGAVLRVVTSAQGIASLKSIIDGVVAATSTLGVSTGAVAKGFLDLSAAIADAFGDRFATAVADLAGRMGQFMSQIASSGQAVAWVEGALLAFRQLGDVVANVGGILKGVMSASAGSGNSMLTVLQQITAALSEWANSMAGQQALTAIFDGLGAAGSALASIFTALSPVINVAAVAFQQLMLAVGPVIEQLAAALTPLIQLIASTMIPVITQLGTSLGQVLTALMTALTPVIQQLTAGLAQVLPVLAAEAVRLVQALAPLAVQLIQQLAPYLPVVAAKFTELVVALLPLIPVLVDLVVQAAPVVALLLRMIPVVITLADRVFNLRGAFTAVKWVIETVVGLLSIFIGRSDRASGSASGFASAVENAMARATGAAEAASARLGAALGNIAAQLAQVAAARAQAQAYSSVRPRGAPPNARFADGGIIDRPVIALMGEGHKKEVVIPLTKPQRAVELAQQSGLLDILAGAASGGGGGGARPSGGGGGPVGRPVNITINEVGDARTTARRVASRLALEAGVI